MMKNILGALMMIIAFSACAKSKLGKTPSITYLKMERTACFGKCPTYAVEVYKNGLVRYTGRQFTDYTGPYEKNIGTKNAIALLKKFETYRIDTCKNVYEAMIADMPGVYYTFTINGKEKEIANAHFGPKYFIQLSRDVDAVAKPDSSWKKMPSPDTDSSK